MFVRFTEWNAWFNAWWNACRSRRMWHEKTPGCVLTPAIRRPLEICPKNKVGSIVSFRGQDWKWGPIETLGTRLISTTSENWTPMADFRTFFKKLLSFIKSTTDLIQILQSCSFASPTFFAFGLFIQSLGLSAIILNIFHSSDLILVHWKLPTMVKWC